MYGIHDWDPAWGSLLKAENVRGWCVTTHALTVQRAHDFRDMAAYNVTPIARLNWGYGTTGTIPLPKDYVQYAERCAIFVRESVGCNIWQIGNEPNHPQEWPDNQRISPDEYIQCYRLTRETIKHVSPNAIVIPAPIAPWTAAVGLGWIEYFQYVLSRVEADAISIHAYTRGADPNAITSDAKMDPPFQQYYSGFRCYRDFLAAIPSQHRHLPVHITEFDENEPWTDANTGVVQAAYREIHNWNQQAATQKIHSLSLFRWPAFDERWHIEGKQGVITDFRAALQQRYTTVPTGQEDTDYLPIVAKPPERTPPVATPNVVWDPPNLKTLRGVDIVPAKVAPGEKYWKVVKVRWYNEQEADEIGPDHHILIDTLDEQGRRVTGLPLLITWPSGSWRIFSEAKPGERWSANYPMSKSLNEFSVRVANDIRSDQITGIGMGADGNSGIHTSTEIVFQRTIASSQSTRPATPSPDSTLKFGSLLSPIAENFSPVIIQRFGARPEAYAQFYLAGHNGLDFAVPVGTPIRAVDSGTIIETGEDPTGYGKYVKLEHSWGQSLYAHLSTIKTTRGSIARGTVLGQSGNTGNSEGPHLHLGIRLLPIRRGAQDPTGFDGYKNPEPYLSKESSPTVPVGSEPLLTMVRSIAIETGIDPVLLFSLVIAESSGNPQAVSSAGATGLGQLMPATWNEWAPRVGVSNIFDPRDNLKVTAAYLKWQLGMFSGDILRALWGYNWGAGRVLEGYQPPAITQEYARKIIFGMEVLRAANIS